MTSSVNPNRRPLVTTAPSRPAESTPRSGLQQSIGERFFAQQEADGFSASAAANKLMDLGVTPSLIEQTVSRKQKPGHNQRPSQPVGNGTVLNATPAQAKAIAAGEHQIWQVDGDKIESPSQNIDMIESTTPYERGQTHTKTKHVGQTLEDNIDRLNKQKGIPAAGGFYDIKSGQIAVDRTIANPANQKYIEEFMADGGRYKDALLRVDLGESVGTNTLRSDLKAGNPCLRPATTATVVLIKDPSFPEGYRVLTAYPEATRKPDVDAEGNRV